MVKLNVVYICDKKACPFPQSCKRFKDYECHHTSKPEHAKNGVCLDPWNHLDRFEVIGENQYWEKE